MKKVSAQLFKRNDVMKHRAGLTIIELLIGVSLLALVTGGVLGLFVIIQQYFQDGVITADVQAEARLVAEKMIRPIRHGKSYTISDDGNNLTLTRYDDTIDVFKFENGEFKRNDNVIGTNIVQIPDKVVFQSTEDKRVAINFGVKRQGVFRGYKEIHIETEMKIRN